jgi:hypothetical protein
MALSGGFQTQINTFSNINSGEKKMPVLVNGKRGSATSQAHVEDIRTFYDKDTVHTIR